MQHTFLLMLLWACAMVGTLTAAPLTSNAALPANVVAPPADTPEEAHERHLLEQSMIRADNCKKQRWKMAAFDAGVTGTAMLEVASMVTGLPIAVAVLQNFIGFDSILTRFRTFDYYTTPPGFLPISLNVPEPKWEGRSFYNLSLSYVRDDRLQPDMQIKSKTTLYDKFLMASQTQMLSLHNDIVGNFSDVKHGPEIKAITRSYICLTPDYMNPGDDVEIQMRPIQNPKVLFKQQHDARKNITTAPTTNPLEQNFRIRAMSNTFDTGNQRLMNKMYAMFLPSFQLQEIHCVLYKEAYNVIEPITTKGAKLSPDLPKVPAGVKIIDRISNKNETTVVNNNNSTVAAE